MESVGKIIDAHFWKGKKVFVTGHTGFKGSWLTKILVNFGAEVTGYGLLPSTDPNLFTILNTDKNINSIIGDIRDSCFLERSFSEARPDIVIHLAAQPIVRESYVNPVYTYETNVIGTVNILECIRKTNYVRSFLNVTTDKVYQNKELERGYEENDNLGGFDPYSNSKACSELITDSYKKSFFSNRDISISTARAGNVIGGGDFAKDRIIPDCVRAIEANSEIVLRNPNSVRPYQHVLESLYAYLMILQKQYEDENYAGYYNVGPDICDCVTTEYLVELFCGNWNRVAYRKQTYMVQNDGGPHEAKFLKLDCSKIKSCFGWEPKWNIETSVEKTVDWVNAYINNGNIGAVMDKQIYEFIGD